MFDTSLLEACFCVCVAIVVGGTIGVSSDDLVSNGEPINSAMCLLSPIIFSYVLRSYIALV